MSAPMTEVSALEDLRAEVGRLARRVEELENRLAARQSGPVPPSANAASEDDISEEEMLAISAAVAAYLGVRAHVRQVRLIRSDAWTQVGRISIQSSHNLH